MKKNNPTANPPKNAAAPAVKSSKKETVTPPPPVKEAPAPDPVPIGAVRLTKAQMAEVAGVVRGLARKSTLPGAVCLLIDSQDGRVRLHATDLDTHAVFTIAAPPKPVGSLAQNVLLARYARENGAFLIPLVDFARIAKAAAPHDAVVLQGEGGPHERTAHSVKASYVINGTLIVEDIKSLPVEAFPMVHQLDREYPGEVTVDTKFLDGFRHAMAVSSEDTTRYVLQGVAFDGSEENRSAVIGTDGRRLFCQNVPALPFKDVRVIPATPVTRPLAAPLQNPGWTMAFTKDAPADSNNPVRFRAGAWEFHLRLIAGNYPNWRQVLPDLRKKPLATVYIPAAAREFILKTLPAVPKASEDAKVESIELRIDGEFAIRRGKTVMPVHGAQVQGKEIAICFQPEFFLHALRMGMETLKVWNKLDAGDFSVGDARYVLMPMRVKE